MSPKVCSATVMDVAAGVLATKMPFSLAASRSIEPDAGPDQDLEVPARLDDGAGDLGGAAHDDGAVAGDDLDEIGLAHALVNGDLETRNGLQLFEGRLVHAVGDEDLGHCQFSLRTA
jgi:hypothetical protein